MRDGSSKARPEAPPIGTDVEIPVGDDDGEREEPVPDIEDLIARYGDFVFGFAVHLTGNRDEAADLAQDAFIRILRGLSSYRGDASLKTWIGRIVINCHRNRSRWWRRLKRGRATSIEEPVGTAEQDGPTIGATLVDPAPRPDRRLEGREAMSRLETELSRLPPQQRAALVMREVEGMSYEEIATALGVRPGTVKSRLGRAREKLRIALADLLGDEARR